MINNNNTMAGSIESFLVFIWFLTSGLKILFVNIIYFDDFEITQAFVSSLFWGVGCFIIIRGFLSLKYWSYTFLISCLILLSFSILNIGLITFVFAVIVWCAISNILNEEKFRRVYLFSLFLLIVLVLLSVLFFGQIYYFDARYGNVPSFGFANSNSFPQLLVVFLLIAANHFRLSLLYSVSLLFFAYIGIKTRSFYLIMIVYPFMFLLMRFIKTRLVIFVPIILFVSSIILVEYSNTDWGITVDQLFSFRLRLSYQLLGYLEPYQWVIGSSYKPDFPMDMSYINLVFSFGIISAILMVSLYTILLYRLYIQDNYRLIAFVLCFLLYAFVENVFINYYLNPTLYYAFFYGIKFNKKIIT